MKAEIAPLEGKYYGTEIRIIGLPFPCTNYNGTCAFTIWYSANYQPSDRELDKAGITREDYNNNSLIECGDGETLPARAFLEICDSHFESQFTYELAQLIVHAINKKG